MATVINRNSLKTIREDINEALAAVAKKHGLYLEIGNIRFDDSSFTTKLAAKSLTGVSSKAGTPVTSSDVAKDTWEKYATMYGLEKDWFGKVVTLSGSRMKITGLLINKRKNVVEVTGAQGGKYITCAATIRRVMGK